MPTINIERAPDRIKVRYKGASKALRDLQYDIGQDLVKEVQEFTPVGWTGLLNGAWYARRTRTGFELVNRTPYADIDSCLLYTSPSPRDGLLSRMPSSA